jgi:hypothetical protein
MGFGTWKVSRVCGSGSLKTVGLSKEVIKYKLFLVAVQDVRWD